MRFRNSFFALFSLAFSLPACSQNMEDVKIEAVQINDHIYMLLGRGGNIGLSVGDDGVFVIDDQFAALTPKILEAIRAISDQPLRFLVNTHWHGDHTGGNSKMTEAGATIMSHDNVRKRLAETPLRQGGMRPKTALPVITFNDEMNLHMNGDAVSIYHVDNAHTDGDAIIYFTDSNVVHTGDTYFNGRYPYIDLNSGGSIDGYIAAVQRTLMLIDDETKIIPGHGNMSNKKEYGDFLNMLKEIRNLVQGEIDKGKTEEEVAANTALFKTYDDKGFGSGFINSERAKRIIYKSLTAN